MESSGHGKVNLDDEDPDMDDWSDFDDDSVDGDGSEDDEDAAAFDRTLGNEDAFMDAPSSDEDFEGDAIDTNNFDDDDDDDDDHFPMMLGDDEDFSDDEEEALPTKKKKSESLYADADEYEKILEEELNAMGKSEEGNDSVNSSHRKKKKRKIK